MTLADFPTLAATLSGHTAKMMTAALADINAGVAAGQISNTAYQDAKAAVSQAIEAGWKATAQESYLVQRRNGIENASDQDIYYMGPMPHTISASLKRLAKCEATPVRAIALKFLQEVEPIATALMSLKDKVVKRQPKALDDKTKPVSYNGERITQSAIEIVKPILTEITEANYQKMLKVQIDWAMGKLHAYEAALDQDKTLSPRKFFVTLPTQQKGDHAADHQGEMIVRSYARSVGIPGIDQTYQIDPRAAQQIETEMTRMVDECRQAFIHKNLAKIAAIVEKKGNFFKAEILGSDVRLNGLEGTIRFTFKDGAQFTVCNKAVHAVSPRGTHFMRFPLTFHGVFNSDGSKVRVPSEEKVNKEFH